MDQESVVYYDNHALFLLHKVPGIEGLEFLKECSIFKMVLEKDMQFQKSLLVTMLFNNHFVCQSVALRRNVIFSELCEVYSFPKSALYTTYFVCRSVSQMSIFYENSLIFFNSPYILFLGSSFSLSLFYGN